MHDFDVLGEVRNVEIIAAGAAVRVAARLRRRYGGSRWRKLKGIATIRLRDGTIVQNVEIHWYEAHGVGRRELKVK
jgi:hypothetical protein